MCMGEEGGWGGGGVCKGVQLAGCGSRGPQAVIRRRKVIDS